MKEITKTFKNKFKYDFSKLGQIEKLLFFDIETTGLSPKNSNLYLIGCACFNNPDEIIFKQWFAEGLLDESLLLKSFYAFAKNFDTLVHFNGEGFDLPYLRGCARQYYIFNPLEDYGSIDIYKTVRYLKKPLELEHINQKSLERYLGLNREDIYTGGDLISFYFKYIENRSEKLLNSLLLHNEEDILGMLKTAEMMSFVDFFNSDFLLKSHRIQDSLLILDYKSDEYLSRDLNLCQDIGLYISGNKLQISIPLLHGEMKYFFDNYKDYFYLTAEDYAIHKSIGEFVDKAFKKRATKQTAYIKSTSDYIPVFNMEVPFEIFKKEYKNKENYIKLDKLDFNDSIFFNSYAKEILRYLKLLR